jgi:hypothetical protein
VQRVTRKKVFEFEQNQTRNYILNSFPRAIQETGRKCIGTHFLPLNSTHPVGSQILFSLHLTKFQDGISETHGRQAVIRFLAAGPPIEGDKLRLTAAAIRFCRVKEMPCNL